MRSLILGTAARFLLPLLLMFSLFLLFRGHNSPGGGFAGGLVVVGAWTLYAIAYDLNAAGRLVPVEPRLLIAGGLLSAVGSALVSTLSGLPFMTGRWIAFHLPLLGEFHLGTPAIFDIGVYLVVTGVGIVIIRTLSEEGD